MSAGNTSIRRCGLLLTAVLWTGTVLAQSTPSQSGSIERTFQASKAQVDAVLKALQAKDGARLPTVDGFVIPQTQGLERFQKPHYTYTIRVLSKSHAGATVQIKAHITAWFAALDVAKAGYRELISNGRLETDLLERLEDSLARTSVASPQSSGPAPAPPTVKLPSSKPSPATTANPFFILSRPGATTLPPRMGDTAPSKPDAANSAQALKDQADALEEILRNQTRPTDLAAVKQSRTPVYSRPSEEAEVLFLAEAQDEFQVLNTSSEWVHVQISGLSRGWIRGPALELPTRSSTSTGRTATPQAAGGETTFRLSRQEVNIYPGDWAPLRGKSVRIMSLEPTGTGNSTGSEKWEVSKAMFQRAAARLAAQEASPTTQTVEGVVLIFDSADGGMASTTLTSLQEWYAGRLSDDDFRAQCSFDPPEAFQTSAPVKPS